MPLHFFNVTALLLDFQIDSFENLFWLGASFFKI